MLRSNDVHCAPIILSTPDETPTHRLGSYYLEAGFGIRPSKVIYDRKHSAITEYDFSKVDLKKLLTGFTWLHLSGITPALAPNCRQLIMDTLKVAKALGITVSSMETSAVHYGHGKRQETSAHSVCHTLMC